MNAASGDLGIIRPYRPARDFPLAVPAWAAQIRAMPEQPQTPPIVDPLAIGRAIAEPYHNRSIATVNDHEVRLSVMTSGFPWHRHPDSDETFTVLEGELVIEFETGEVILKPGQFLTVPRGTLHRTRPNGARSVNITFERIDAATEFDGEDGGAGQ